MFLQITSNAQYIHIINPSDNIIINITDHKLVPSLEL